jgi:hypothetical protein
MWPNTMTFFFYLAIDLILYNKKEKKPDKIVTLKRCFSLKKKVGFKLKIKGHWLNIGIFSSVINV